MFYYGYWWLLMTIILMAIGEYLLWILVVINVIILMTIGEYSIMDIGGY
jgi:hypothetical protein